MPSASSAVQEPEPEPGRLLSEHRGVAAAPLERVRAAMLEVRTGRVEVPLVLAAQRRDGGILIEGGPDRYTARLGDVTLTLDLDRGAGRVTVTGPKWCGVYTVEPHPEGALLTYRVYRLGGRLWTVGRAHRERAAGSLRTILAGLLDRLGCSTRILPS
jgi:hypothetical protein